MLVRRIREFHKIIFREKIKPMTQRNQEYKKEDEGVLCSKSQKDRLTQPQNPHLTVLVDPSLGITAAPMSGCGFDLRLLKEQLYTLGSRCWGS